MYVSHLSLIDFRSYAAVDVELEPGPNAFVGRNGQGKTNLVEAIGYVATLGSHRVANDSQNRPRLVVRARGCFLFRSVRERVPPFRVSRPTFSPVLKGAGS